MIPRIKNEYSIAELQSLIAAENDLDTGVAREFATLLEREIQVALASSKVIHIGNYLKIWLTDDGRIRMSKTVQFERLFEEQQDAKLR